jgi:Flp pilus assembly pilin Flp
MKWLRRFRSLQRDQRGLSTVEYTVLLVLILAGAITLWKKLGNEVYTKLDGAEKTFATDVAPSTGSGSGPTK